MPYDFGPQQAIAYLVERGVPQHVAAGFAGNFRSESGWDPGINEIDPLVEGSRGGFGLYQLTGPRRRQYESWAPQQGRGLSDPYAQLDFMLEELNTTEREARDAIFAARDVDEAARLVSEEFLRPGIPHLDRRINAAREYAGLEPMRPGPTRERAALGIPLAEEELEYADNALGRAQRWRDEKRAGLGDRIGMDDKRLSGMGRGLQALGQQIMMGEF